jgi:hypothetical protein
MSARRRRQRGQGAGTPRPEPPPTRLPESESDNRDALEPPPAARPAAARLADDAQDTLSGEVLPPATAGTRPSAPDSGLDLTYRLWMTLSWSRTGQVIAILAAVALALIGAGIAVRAAAGAAGLWTALGGAAAGAGARELRHLTRARSIGRRHRPG